MADLTRVHVGSVIECVEGIFGITKISGDNYYYSELMFVVDGEARPVDHDMDGVWTARELKNDKYQIW